MCAGCIVCLAVVCVVFVVVTACIVFAVLCVVVVFAVVVVAVACSASDGVCVAAVGCADLGFLSCDLFRDLFVWFCGAFQPVECHALGLSWSSICSSSES